MTTKNLRAALEIPPHPLKARLAKVRVPVVQAARFAGVGYSSLHAWLAGHRTMPRDVERKLLRLCNDLDAAEAGE